MSPSISLSLLLLSHGRQNLFLVQQLPCFMPATCMMQTFFLCCEETGGEDFSGKDWDRFKDKVWISHLSHLEKEEGRRAAASSHSSTLSPLFTPLFAFGPLRTLSFLFCHLPLCLFPPHTSCLSAPLCFCCLARTHLLPALSPGLYLCEMWDRTGRQEQFCVWSSLLFLVIGQVVK